MFRVIQLDMNGIITLSTNTIGQGTRINLKNQLSG
jgi:hypothetical protein